MAVYRDIDSSVRINGELTLPAGSLTIGSNKINLNVSDGAVTALSYKVGATTIIETDGKIHWNKIKNAPSTYAPSAHTHAISEVTGLQTALDGKSATTHLHDDRYLQLTGGSVTGVTTFTEVSTFTKGTVHTGESKFYIGTYVDPHNGTSYAIKASGGIAADKLYLTGNLTVNGTVDGVDIAALKSSYDSHNHDSRYYTESEMDTKLATKSDTSHTHTFASLTSKPTTLAGYGITDASASGHTHTFASLTSKPTTLSGYGITDASLSTHLHDDRYLQLIGGTLSADLTISNTNGASVFLNSAQLRGNANGAAILSSNGTDAAIYLRPAGTASTTGQVYLTSTVFTYDGFTVYHSGNFTPGNKADKATTISAGTGLTGGGDLSANRTISANFTTSGGNNGTATTIARGDHNHDNAYLKLTGGTLTGSFKVNVASTNAQMAEFISTSGSISVKGWTGQNYIQSDQDLYLTGYNTAVMSKFVVSANASEFSGTVKGTSYLVGSTAVIETDGKINWNKLKSVPSSFVPSAHTHAISEVTGLQTALDGKSASGHTHAFSELTSKPNTLDGYGITDAAPSLTANSGSLNSFRTTGFMPLPMFGDVLRFVKPSLVEYHNGTDWVTWTGTNMDVLTDGRADTTVNIDYTHSQIRITYPAQSWGYGTLLYICSSYNSPGGTLMVESTKDDWVTTNVRLPETGGALGQYWKYANIANYNEDTKIRLTMKYNTTSSTADWQLLQIMLITSRPGEQGSAMETLFPYSWDINKNLWGVNDFKANKLMKADGTEVSYSGHTHDDRYYTESEIDTKLSGKSDTSHTHTFASLTSKPTTLSGFGITDAATSGHTHTFASLTSKPTTLSGYGITDAALATHNHDTAYADINHNHDATYLKLSGGSLTGTLTGNSNGFTLPTGGSDKGYGIDGKLAGGLGMFYGWSTSTIFLNTYSNGGTKTNTVSNVEIGGNVTTRGTLTSNSTINAVGGLQENGTAISSKYVSQSITVTGGTGLTGGGALSANQTLSVSFGGNGSATTVARSDHNHDAAYSAVGHNHDSAYPKQGSNNASIYAEDDRDISPADYSTGVREVAFKFTALNNDSAAPYADAMVFSTYPNSSGGNLNMLLFQKTSGSGVYHRTAAWGATTWGSARKLAYEDETVQKTITISPGSGLTGGGDLSANRTLSVNFAGTGSATTVSRSDHNHDSSYLSLNGGILTGGLTIASTLKDSRLTTGNTQLINTGTGNTIYVGNPSTNLILETGSVLKVNIAGSQRDIWHAGNFTPADKMDASTPVIRKDQDATANMNLITKSIGNAKNGLHLPFVDGGSYLSSASMSTATGAIKISLPQSWTSTMMKFIVDVFDYAGDESFSVHVAGYNYSSGTDSKWFNTSAYILGSKIDRGFTIRYGHDGTTCCVYIGELGSTWSYPQIRVRDFVGGYGGATADRWSEGWGVSFEATAFGSVTATESNTLVMSSYSLDSDKLDGQHGSHYAIASEVLKKDGSVTMTGGLNMGTNFLILNKGGGLSLRGSSTDNTDGSPWYGLGNSTLKFTNQTGEIVQLGGYFGLRFRTSNATFDIDPSDTSAPKYNGNKLWHAGNLDPSTLIVGGGANQSAGNNFTVKGMLYVGESGATGDVAVADSSGSRRIHIDGGSEGKVNASTVNIHIKGNGSAEFKDKVTVKNLEVTDSSGTLVSNLNAQYLNGKQEYEFDKNISNAEIGGYGVYSGLDVKATTPPGSNALVTAGVVYTMSGRRFDIPETQVAFDGASATYDRIDTIYIEGPSGVNGPEGSIRVVKGYADAVPVPPSRAAQGESPNADGSRPKLPYDAVVIADVYKRQNVNDITDGLSGTYDALTDRREWKHVRLIDGIFNVIANLTTTGSIREAGTLLSDKYVQYTTDNTYTGRYTKFTHSSGPVVTIEGSAANSTDTKAPVLYLKEDNDYGFQLKYLGSANNFSLGSISLGAYTERISINRDTRVTKLKDSVEISGTLTASKNAGTVTISAGQTSVRWTHNFGNTSYAISPSANSPARHIFWGNKTANYIDIQIDDPHDQDILVDVVIIGY